MCKQKKLAYSSIAAALSTIFPAIGAYAADDDIKALTSPDKAEVAVRVPYFDKINPLYRQYSGVNNDGVNGSLDAVLIKRTEDGTWLIAKARDVGLSTVEFGASYGKQGDWSLGVDYNQIMRYAPYGVDTAVMGIGSNVITQPNVTLTANKPTAPGLVSTTLKTERDVTTFTASKYLWDGLQLNFSFKNEDKKGVRMHSVAGCGYSTAASGTAQCSAPYPNLYGYFLYAPEPINQKHQQFEAIVDYTTKQLQLQFGYYGSFLDTKYDSLAILPGNNTQLAAQLATNVLSPIALAPDNSLQQVYLNGAYNFSKDTRANFKVAHSVGKQADTFFGGFVAGNAPRAGTGSDLGGKIVTTEASAAITSRVTKDLKLLASWRFEDKDDKTSTRVFFTNGTTNNPESHIANKGKFEADYHIGAGYSMTGGVDYADKKSHEWERKQITEWTGRLALKKSMSETVNGQVQYARSDRTGSDWEAPVPAIYPSYLADRTRDKVRAMLDWSATEKLNLQVAYEGYFDDYKKSTYGLDKGNGQIFSVDGSYTINDTWNVNSWYSKQIGNARQFAFGAYCSSAAVACATTNVAWNATLKSDSDQFGFGIKGKIQGIDIGAQYLYSRDTNKQQMAANNAFAGAPAGWGTLPDTKYTLQTIKLFGVYEVSKATQLRLDYIYDNRKMDDFTWRNWVYADGTRVNVTPNQTTQIFGLTIIQSF